MKNNIISNRKVYLDVLRILAIFLVLFTHTGLDGNKLYTVATKTTLQTVYAMLDCFRTINNPLLFMISGALLLGKNEDIATIYRKRVLRFLVCLLLFSYIQAIWNYCHSSKTDIFNIWETFKSLLSGPVRLQYWYLYSYISFLVMLPFLRSIAQRMDNVQFKYLFFLSIVIMDLFPLISLKLGIAKINFTIFLNSFTTLYPLLGYYLDNYGESIMKTWMYPVIGILMLVGVFLAARMTIWNYAKSGNWEERYITLFYTFTAVTVFLLVKECVCLFGKNNLLKPIGIRFIQYISGTMFGIYLLENILESFTKPMFNALIKYMPRIFACGIWLVITMMFGNIIVALMKKVPGLKK